LADGHFFSTLTWGLNEKHRAGWNWKLTWHHLEVKNHNHGKGEEAKEKMVMNNKIAMGATHIGFSGMFFVVQSYT